jgi:hypothetical protein
MNKYGRKPARYNHASFLRSHILARHLSALGPAPASSPDWVSAVAAQSPSGWGMDGNDLYGDCVIADCAHQEMLRTANVATIWTPTNLQVLAFYAQQQGYTGDPSDINAIEAYLADNDNGCDELTVIQYLTSNGWLGRKLESHANLDVTQLDQLKWVVCIFGASRLGLNLPDSAMDQFNNGEPWDYVPGAQLDGGHDVPLVQYSAANGVTAYGVVTWGAFQEVTEAFLTAKYDDGTPYLEEAHAELAFDWVSAKGTAPSNLNLAQLAADLSAVVDAPPVDAPPPPAPAPTPAPTPTPPAPITKQTLAKLVMGVINADMAKASISEPQMKANIQGVLNAN